MRSSSGAESDPVILVHWASWSPYRKGLAYYNISDVDPLLFTHFCWAFFQYSDVGDFTPFDDNYEAFLKDVQDLKKKNTRLKILVSVGGRTHRSNIFSEISASAAKRNRSVTTTVSFLKTHGFDGLDLSWIYPAQEGGNREDKQNFITLLTEMKKALSGHNLLLIASVAAAETSARISYDIPRLVSEVDFINIMAYDFTVRQEEVLDFGNPLAGEGPNSVKAAIEYWLSQGAPANKLLMGISLYGNSYTLLDSSKVKPGDPCKGLGDKGCYVEKGKLAYIEIYENLRNGWNRSSETTVAPYAYNDTQWVSYEDTRSIEDKMEYLKSVKLRGVAIWTLDADDFKGKCGVKYPFLKAILRGMS